jgi:hypothetical protein
MKAAGITFFSLVSIFNLLAQPDLYPEMKLDDIDSVISPIRPADSIRYAPVIPGRYRYNPYLRINKINDGMPSII